MVNKTLARSHRLTIAFTISPQPLTFHVHFSTKLSSSSNPAPLPKMKFPNPATVLAILLALIVSLVACNPVAGTPTAAIIVTRATVAPEIPIFPMVS